VRGSETKEKENRCKRSTRFLGHEENNDKPRRKP